jgi:predicted metal-binding membrane protein
VDVDGAAIRRRSSLRPLWVSAVLLAAALGMWIVVAERMQGMDAGPGTSPGALGWFLGIWVTMMAAMMLPSVAPVVTLFARVAGGREHGRRAPPLTLCFAVGYFAVWTIYGLAAYGLYQLVDDVDGDLLAWDRAGPWVAGGAIVAAGIYQLTPLKRICLRHCRSPLHFLLGNWRPGASGAVRMGVTHGSYCVGCCWGLMLILFAVGVMSIFWMVVVAAVIFAEKVLPMGDRLSVPLAVAFVAFGIWVAVSPGSVPRLTDPGDAPMMMESARS